MRGCVIQQQECFSLSEIVMIELYCCGPGLLFWQIATDIQLNFTQFPLRLPQSFVFKSTVVLEIRLYCCRISVQSFAESLQPNHSKELYCCDPGLLFWLLRTSSKINKEGSWVVPLQGFCTVHFIGCQRTSRPHDS